MTAKALLLIDIQNDYFPAGAFPLPKMLAAAKNAAALLAWARKNAIKIIHVRHEELDPSSGFLIKGTSGTEIHPSVAALPTELIITKNFPNSFRDTLLAQELGGVKQVLIAGAMSNMCIDATARAAFDLGHDVTVVEDACAACDLEFQGNALPAATVQGAFMAALASVYGRVLSTAEAIGA